MTSWHEPQREPNSREWRGLLAIAIGLPIAFVTAFFLLSALLEEIARWFA